MAPLCFAFANKGPELIIRPTNMMLHNTCHNTLALLLWGVLRVYRWQMGYTSSRTGANLLTHQQQTSS